MGDIERLIDDAVEHVIEVALVAVIIYVAVLLVTELGVRQMARSPMQSRDIRPITFLQV